MIKKAIKTTFLGILLLVALALSACLDKEGYSIKLCAFSDGGSSGVSHEIEYPLWNGGYYEDPTAEKRLVSRIGNLNIDAEYVNSVINTYEYYATHRYRDENKSYYVIADDGKLCNYFCRKGEISDTDRIYTEEECIAIAREFLNTIVDSSAYTVRAAHDEEHGFYSVSFLKKINGFRCADSAYIRVLENGRIYTFHSFMLGEIPNDAVFEFDTAEIEKQIAANLDEKYEKVKEKYDTISYEDFEYVLTRTEDGEYALVCYVDIELIDHYEENDVVISERLTFFIR